MNHAQAETPEIPVETPQRVGSRKRPASPQLDCAMDQLIVMISQQELRYPPPKDYLGQVDQPTSKQDCVTEAWRRRICEWIFQVVDYFSFDREVVSIALEYLDRTVAGISFGANGTYTSMPKREFQLIAVTSLYMAIKLHGETDEGEGRRLKVKIGAFEELSTGSFKVETIEETERRILSQLEWHVNPPTACQFVAYLIRLLPNWSASPGQPSNRQVTSRLFGIAKYLTELSCFDSYSSFHSKPSVVAYASILCAIESTRSSLSIPYDVEMSFIQNVHSVMNTLTPSDIDVIRMQEKLKSLSPSDVSFEAPPLARVVSLLDTEKANQSTESSRESPTCVCGDTTPTQRKRPRTGSQTESQAPPTRRLRNEKE